MLPAWVKKQDGRLVPFEADQISQALFEASEALGQPNAFLAREMTDGVLHFLAQDQVGETTTTVAIVELVTKVVRELGQLELARAYAEKLDLPQLPVTKSPLVLSVRYSSPAESPDAVLARCAAQFSLRAIFSRDLSAAQEENLLDLGGLDQPGRLAALLLDPPAPDHRPTWKQSFQSVRESCHRAGSWLVLDSPEWALSGARLVDQREWMHGLFAALDGGTRGLSVQVHTRQPPAWAQERGMGPLFGKETREHDPEARRAVLSILVEEWFREKPQFPFHIDWHLSASENRLEDLHAVWSDRLIDAVESGLLRFVFDRTRGPLPLGQGLDRHHPGTLMEVGLNLDRFLTMPRIAEDAGVFLEKLPTLVRMAVTAGVQKRKYLRQTAEHLARGFLLDRSRLVLVPRGLNEVVERLLGQPIPATRLTLDLAQKILRRLHETIVEEARQANLDLVLSMPLQGSLDPHGDCGLLVPIGELHALAGDGTVELLQVPGSAKSTWENIQSVLDFANQQTRVQRLFLSKRRLQLQQMELV